MAASSFPSNSMAEVRKPGSLSVFCVPICFSHLPPRCIRVTDERKCLFWLTAKGDTVPPSRDAGARGSWSHGICSQEPERDDCLYSTSFLLFIQSGSLDHRTVAPKFRVRGGIFPLQANFSRSTSQTHHKFISYVFLNPAKMPVKTPCCPPPSCPPTYKHRPCDPDLSLFEWGRT